MSSIWTIFIIKKKCSVSVELTNYKLPTFTAEDHWPIGNYILTHLYDKSSVTVFLDTVNFLFVFVKMCKTKSQEKATGKTGIDA